MNDQMNEVIQWVTRHNTNVPNWAKYMCCERSDRYYGYFFSKKPQFDFKQGMFFSNGARSERFTTEAPSYSVRYNISSGHLRVMESGEAMNLHEDIDAEDDTQFKCGYCGYHFTKPGEYSAVVSNVVAGHSTVKIHYDVKCYNCGRSTTIGMRIASPLSVQDAIFTNIT